MIISLFVDSKPRYLKKIQYEKYACKEVFKDVEIEDTDLHFAMTGFDWAGIDFQGGIALSEEEQPKLKRLLQLHMPLIKEIFVHLQGISEKFPFVDYFTFYEHFLKKGQFPMHRHD